MEPTIGVRITLFLTIFYFTDVESAVDMESCDGLPLPNEFHFGSCNGNVCGTIAGSPTEMRIDFTGQHSSERLNLVVDFWTWYFSTREVFEGMCDNIVKGSCPLHANQRYIATADAAMPTSAASHTFNVKSRLIDENGKAHFCFQFRIAVTRSWLNFMKQGYLKVNRLEEEDDKEESVTYENL